MTQDRNHTTPSDEDSERGDAHGGSIETVANQRVTGSVFSQMNDGWIKLPRSIADTWMYRNPHYLKIWVHLLISANFRQSTAYVGGHLTTIERGDVLTSIRSLAQATGATEKQVRTFLNLGQKSGIIRAKKGTGATVVSIIDYDTLQGRPDEQGHTKGTRRAHEGHYHKNEEGRSNYTIPETIDRGATLSRSRPRSQDEAVAFFIAIGSTEAEGATFWDHFESNGWRVAGKAPMKNWQSAAKNWVRRNNTRKTTHEKRTTGDRSLEAGTAESIGKLLQLRRPVGPAGNTPLELAGSDRGQTGVGAAAENRPKPPELFLGRITDT